MKSYMSALAGLIAIACGLATAQAAFIIQPDIDGASSPTAVTLNPKVTYGNGGTTASASAAATTPGLAPGNSLFGGNGAPGDQYIYTYTVGTDVDNATFAAGADLGAGNLATGLTGGGTGLYRAFATWPVTANITANQSTNYVAESDLLAVNVNLNQDSDVGGIGNAWNLIGVVHLTAGQTYRIMQTAPDSSFVSMRSAGVMWERIIPEPSSLILAGLALVGLGMRRR